MSKRSKLLRSCPAPHAKTMVLMSSAVTKGSSLAYLAQVFDPATFGGIHQQPILLHLDAMRQHHRLLAVALLAAQHAIAQSSSSATIFLLDAEPQTVEASIIAYTSISGQEPITTLLLSCPSAFAPCISAAIDGATAYHTQGSVFGGTLPGATPTTFYCELGSSGSGSDDTDGHCNRTVGSETTSTVINSGYVHAHQARMIITAGLEKIPASRTRCSSRRELFSGTTTVTTADLWGMATECLSATATITTPSQTSSEIAKQTSSQTSQTSSQVSQTSSPTSSQVTSGTTTSPASSSSSSAAATETKASGASGRIAGSLTLAHVLGVAVAVGWLVL